MSVRATVRNGRLTLDEPTELPEGTPFDERELAVGELGVHHALAPLGGPIDLEQIVDQVRALVRDHA
ncbi:MAG: hypothetical protein M3Y87_18205, partial [Myxococcota bacterium]|nr:hypothetical protein [Myxococcota bacterium]